MNSYPPELLAQLAPVMFVAGLGAAPPPPTTPQSPSPKAQDPFAVLAVRLKDALGSQRRVAIWQPDRSKTFQVVFVEPVRDHSEMSPYMQHAADIRGTVLTGCCIRVLQDCVLSIMYLLHRMHASLRGRCHQQKTSSSSLHTRRSPL